MNYRNHQEIFNIGFAGLRSQGFVQSFRTDLGNGLGGCAYRGEEGRKCFIGHLISDEEYDPGFEGTDASDPGILDAAHVAEENNIIALDLQTIHDTHGSPSVMELSYRRYAERNNLTIPA